MAQNKKSAVEVEETVEVEAPVEEAEVVEVEETVEEAEEAPVEEPAPAVVAPSLNVTGKWLGRIGQRKANR